MDDKRARNSAVDIVGLHKNGREVPRASRYPQHTRGIHSDTAPEVGYSHLVWGLMPTVVSPVKDILRLNV